VNGTIPPVAQLVRATYKVGGGVETNAATNTVTRIFGTSDGAPIPAPILSVTNTTAGTGGGDKQSLLNAKRSFPLSLKANDRAVAQSDFVAIAVQVPGVFKANAAAGKPYGGAVPTNLFVMPTGAGAPSDALRNLVGVAFRTRKIPGKRIRVKAPVYVALEIDLDVFVQPSASAAEVSNGVTAVLLTDYSDEANDFGVTLPIQNLYDATGPLDVPGVRRVFVRRFTIAPYYDRHVNSPTTGTGTVEGIAVNNDLVRRREWLIRMIPADPGGGVFCTRFNVLQRRLGTIDALNNTLVTDDAASYAANELVGLAFHPNPELSLSVFAVTGNTAKTITTTPGLLIDSEPGDPYVVESTEALIGKVLRTTLTANAVATNVLTVASSLSFLLGDRVLIRLAGVEVARAVVTLVGGPTSITISTAISTLVGATVDYLWQSGDTSVQFAVIDGATPFVPNSDELYVDTYDDAGDISIRDENFPRLAAADILINAIGGV